MGQVLQMPTNHLRAWRMLEPEYRAILKRSGINDQDAQRILKELAEYVAECDSETRTEFVIPEGLALDQHLAIRSEFDRVINDVRWQMTVPLMGAFGVILRLLVQKHLGQFKPGG